MFVTGTLYARPSLSSLVWKEVCAYETRVVFITMTATPKSSCDDVLGESWVELSSSQQMPLQLQLPQYGAGIGVGVGAADEYIRLLREAQRESNNSSARVSLASSRHLTPRGSPKSPPNSPNTELSTQDDLPGVFINYSGKDVELERTATDWIWDWSSRPDQLPPKDWKFKHPKRKTYSIRQTKIGKNSLFSKEVLYTVFITNVITLLLGTGVGMWLSRRGFLLPRINLE